MEYIFSDAFQRLKPSAIREIFKSLTDPTIISFAAGNPAPESFPVDELAKLSADIFKNSSTAALQYSITEGYPAFREAIAARQKAKFGIGTDKDMTMVVSGGNQGIDLCCRVLCNPGDAVICENPTFIGALNSFRACGAKTVGVDMDEDGMIPEKLEETIKNTKNAKLLYLIPTFQNPRGSTTSLARRRALYEIAKKHGIIILEDNPYGELRFRGEEIPTIKSMDDAGIVVYCSSFSKILSAGMRIGFIIAPEAIVQKMAVGKQCEDVHSNIFFQLLCYKYMTECDLDGHIEKIRAIYRRKCDLMLECLDREMPKEITYTRPDGGLFIWCTLPEGYDSAAFAKFAIAKKVAVVPGATFNCDTEAPSNAFRLNYSTPSDEQIVTGIKTLGEIACEYLSKE
ncbi:MAG: PLP-dependent aminotransferase family protein [Ruminococcaceae bacterium]|nr:PLP-dependent aminotransferase family protein [Oscillospiraceae bacterium]